MNSGNFIYKGKRGTFTKWKSEMIYQKKMEKMNYQKKLLGRKYNKYIIRQLYFGALVYT